MSAHNVDDLVVRMTVASANPIFFHSVLGQQKLVVIRSDTAD